MTKTITHIDCPKEWESENDWDSHRPLLWVSLNNINDMGVVELGMGMGSTPLLEKWCNENAAKHVLSIETNMDWVCKFIKDYRPVPFLKFIGFSKGNHSVVPATSYSKFEHTTPSLIFVDAAPASERKIIIEQHKKGDHVFLVHDTEDGADYVYGMKEILSEFEYRVDYEPIGKPRTTLVSNVINICDWL